MSETLPYKLIDYRGNLIETTGDTYNLKKYLISEGHFYRVNAYSVDKFIPFAVYDENNNCLYCSASLFTSNYAIIHNDYLFVAPRGASYVLVQSNNDNCLIDLGKDSTQIFISPNDSVISSLLSKDDFSNETITITQKKLIQSNGNIANFDDTRYKISETITVNNNNYYYVVCSANYSNCLYAFYDSTMHFLGGKTAASGGAETTFEGVIETPPLARYLILATFSNNSAKQPEFYTFNKVSSIFPWKGKKWVCVGDSLTEVNNRTTKHYHDYIAEKTGISVYNMGLSGSGYRARGSEDKAFYQRILNVPTDADVVTIFGSFNDGLSNLGTADDTGTTTVGGCVNTTLDNLYSIIPTVQLGIVTPTPWIGANPYTNPAANAYADLLLSICQKRSIPILNLYYESNLRPWDSTFRTLAYSKDDGNGVHPDETGHAIIAPRFEGFLNSLLLR